VSIWFLCHLPIYGQWATFVFQVVTYDFFLLILLEFFLSGCNGIKNYVSFDNKISEKNTTFFFRSTLSEFENFLLCERILINVTICQNETSS
jgi:hypothetical protein